VLGTSSVTGPAERASLLAQFRWSTCSFCCLLHGWRVETIPRLCWFCWGELRADLARHACCSVSTLDESTFNVRAFGLVAFLDERPRGSL
jgi:hypothetical protein